MRLDKVMMPYKWIKKRREKMKNKRYEMKMKERNQF